MDSAAPEKRLRDSPVFCILPWTHLNVAPSGNVFPCCVFDSARPIGSVRDSTLDELWNAPGLRRLRLDILAGRESPGCRLCYELERSGFPSMRRKTGKRFGRHLTRATKTRDDGSLPTLHMPYMDIRFSNSCNFRCRTCGPWASDLWQKDWKALNWWGFLSAGKRSLGRAERLWRRIEELAPNLEEVFFAGGEPLLMEEHFRLLDLLSRKKLFHIRLSYNTNFSVLRRDVMELWDRFENVIIGASLDASGSRGEYLRKGQDWGLVLRNRQLLAQTCPRARFRLCATLSVMNSLHLPDFQKEWLEKGWVAPENVTFSLLINPEVFRLQILPPSLKQAVLEKYRRHIDEVLRPLGEKGANAVALFEAAMRFLADRDLSAQLPRFRRLTRRLDRLRGEDFAAAFPELSSLMDG
mgnify:CR=1 FL=1